MLELHSVSQQQLFTFPNQYSLMTHRYFQGKWVQDSLREGMLKSTLYFLCCFVKCFPCTWGVGAPSFHCSSLDFSGIAFGCLLIVFSCVFLSSLLDPSNFVGCVRVLCFGRFQLFSDSAAYLDSFFVSTTPPLILRF